MAKDKTSTVEDMIFEFHTAVRVGTLQQCQEKLDLLRSHDINIDAKSLKGFNAMYFAAQWQRYDICKFLIQNGASVNEKGPQEAGGNTPLHIAYFKGNVDIINLLEKHGADAATLNTHYRSPNHYTPPFKNDDSENNDLKYSAISNYSRYQDDLNQHLASLTIEQHQQELSGKDIIYTTNE